jgi:hypothetical protein
MWSAITFGLALIREKSSLLESQAAWIGGRTRPQSFSRPICGLRSDVTRQNSESCCTP